MNDNLLNLDLLFLGLVYRNMMYLGSFREDDYAFLKNCLNGSYDRITTIGDTKIISIKIVTKVVKSHVDSWSNIEIEEYISKANFICLN